MGSNNNTDSSNFFRAQASNMRGPRSSGVNATTTGTRTEYRIATLRLVGSFGEANNSAHVNFRRLTTSAGAVWIEDADETNLGDEISPIYSYSGGVPKDPTTGTLSVGQEVLILADLPEPTSLGLLGVAGLGLLSRRRSAPSSS